MLAKHLIRLQKFRQLGIHLWNLLPNVKSKIYDLTNHLKNNLRK